ncbi:MAG: hypothetical protein E7C50_00225 [Clostridium sp.]|uniref:hypothetical protein n=1 Tax=Clostridium sp. TaxID=1506 RepID=UPI0028FE68FC|nr:hypothetical protein [Clostridium sp.]MDU2674006.1 hypothetical protein [Clostridium sp.]MDU2680284.1 hypothetical protein [Clostridium sp.]
MVEKFMKAICLKYIKLQKERCDDYMKRLENLDKTTNIEWNIDKAKKDYRLYSEIEKNIITTIYYKDGSKRQLGIGKSAYIDK